MTFGIDRPTASPDDVAAARYAAIEQAGASVAAETRAAAHGPQQNRCVAAAP